MNRFLFIRESLIEIYNKRNDLIKFLVDEIDECDEGNIMSGQAYYNHLNLLLSDIEQNIFNSKPKDINYLPYPPKYEFVKTNYDFSLAISGIDMTTIHSFGYFEPAETVLTQRISKHTNILFDIGANLGYFSFLFKKFSQEDSKVYAFEPESYNYNRFVKAIKFNNMEDSIYAFKIALSDKKGDEQLFINKRGSGGHSLIKIQPEIFTNNYEVIKTQTLDNFIELNNIFGNEVFIKIDVEGGEAKILNKAENFLNNIQPLAILCEIWSSDKTNSQNNLNTIADIISIGYYGFSIQRPKIGLPLIKPIFSENIFNQSYNDNYLFIKKERKDIIDECLKPLLWFELTSNDNLDYLLSIQEKSLLSLIEQHTIIVPKERTNFFKHYISASDGGFPLLQSSDPLSIIAKLRFHHNCGGPAILTIVEKNSLDPLSSIVVGESIYYKNEKGHYSVPLENSVKIVKNDLLKYKPDVVLLMPNNVTSFDIEELIKLRNTYPFFLVARDGDACSYQYQRIQKNLEIAKLVDHFISVDGEFVEIAKSKGYKNVEYIPSFVNEHLISNSNNEKTQDILFTGVGWVGELMDNGQTMYKRRRRFIEKVNMKYGNKLKVIGHAWNDMNLANWTDDFISEDIVHQIASKTKVVICFDGPYTKGFTSVRVFRTIMSGAFVLIRYFPGIENIFENFKHLVWFHGDEEGLELLEYYLNNDIEREKIARTGKQYLISQKNWRRKNIIIDYLFERAQGSNITFSDLYCSFNKPLKLSGSLLNKKINILKRKISNITLSDLVSYVETLIENSQYEEATQLLNEIIEYDEKNLEALNDLSVICIMKGKIEDSINIITKILSIDKENETALNNIDYLKENYYIENITELLRSNK